MKKFILLITTALMCACVAAETIEALVENAIATKFSPEKLAETEKFLNEKPIASTNDFYRRKFDRALNFGFYEKAIEIAQTWEKLATGDDLLWPKWEKSWITFYLGDVEKGIALSEEVYKYMSYPNQEATFSVQLAEKYVKIGRISLAQDALKRAQKATNRTRMESRNPKGFTLCGMAKVDFGIQKVNAQIEALKGNYENALKSLDLILTDRSRSMIKDCQGLYPTWNPGVIEYLKGLEVKINLLISFNKNYLAQLNLREMVVVAAENDQLVLFSANIFESLTELSLSNQSWLDALKFSKVNEKIDPPRESPVNVRSLRIRRGQLDALIGLAKWSEALALQESTDKLAGQSSTFASLWHSPLRRSLVSLKNGKVTEALAMSKEALATQTALTGSNHYLTSQAQGVYAMALHQFGDLPAARLHFESAVSGFVRPHGIVSGSDNTGNNKLYSQFILQDYMRLLESDYKAGDMTAADKAFKVGEMMRGSTVQRSIIEAAARSSTTVKSLSDIVRQEQDSNNQLSALYDFLTRKLNEDHSQLSTDSIKEARQQIASLEIEIKKLSNRITTEFPDYSNLVTPQPATLSEVARKLSKDEALLSFLVTPERSYAWCVTADRAPQWIGIDINQNEVNALVGDLRKTLDLSQQLNQEPLKRFDTVSSFNLYQKFLSPMKMAWQGKESLVISPSGKLSQIPWSVVLTQAPQKSATYAEMPWLINQVAVSHVPSVSGWMALKGLPVGTSNRKPYIGFGDPSFALASLETANAAEIKARGKSLNLEMPLMSTLQYNELPALPETRAEILAIAKALNADTNKDVYLGDRATKANVMNQPLNDRRVISFATHGLVAGDLPQLSQPALAMAGTNNPKESPLLTLEDVMNLKLDADWVVLSACNTASSDGKGDEALSGLGRGFFYAGARSILATHWSVESNSATALVSQTFENYGADNTTTRAQALRAAQLKMVGGKFGHPYYWSAYALVGDGGR